MAEQTSRPDSDPTWAEIPLPYVYTPPNGVGSFSIITEDRAIEPTPDKKQAGFKGGEALPSAWLNWLYRETFRWIRWSRDKEKVTDGAGAELFAFDNAVLELTAVDTDTPTNYLTAVGYRTTGAPVLTVTSSNTLTLGTPLADGTVPVTGAANIRIVGRSTRD